MPQNKRYIISLGGSLIVPDQIDTDFIKKFRDLLVRKTSFGNSFVIAVGGGKTARNYAQAARVLGDKNDVDSDWLGIYAIKLNRLLLSFVFKRDKNIIVMDSPDAKPGHSSDLHAVAFAKRHNAHAIINLSNINFVYDKNPSKHRSAKPLKNVSWTEFRKIVGNKWKPNQSWPFDPIASQQAQKMGLKVIFLNGRNLKNLENFLMGKKFIGTVIG